MKPDEAFGLIFSWDNVIVSFLFVLVYQILCSKCHFGIFLAINVNCRNSANKVYLH
jgi:hypothetical protein